MGRARLLEAAANRSRIIQSACPQNIYNVTTGQHHPRTVTAWIMTRPGNLDPADKDNLQAILASSPELAAVTAHVQAFAALMTGRRGRELEHWMTAAAASGEPSLQSFVTGLRADQDAVTAGLTLQWSSGSVEGHVNRIKMLKRQMYGRASPTCSAAASSSPTNLTETVPEPRFTRC